MKEWFISFSLKTNQVITSSDILLPYHPASKIKITKPQRVKQHPLNTIIPDFLLLKGSYVNHYFNPKENKKHALY